MHMGAQNDIPVPGAVPEQLNALQDIDDVCDAALQREDTVGKLPDGSRAYDIGDNLLTLREQNRRLKGTLLETKQRYKIEVGRLCEVVDTLTAEVEILKVCTAYAPIKRLSLDELTHVLYQSALRAKDELLETIAAERRTCVQLPFELWQMIFRSALPPREDVQIMLASPIRRMRIESFALLKSVVRVNKLWRAAETELLYECVYVEHVGHLAALANSLESSAARGDNTGHCVKMIALDFWHPPECDDMGERDLKAVADLCPRLQCLAVGPKTLGLDRGYPPGQRFQLIPRSLFYSVAGQLERVNIIQYQADSSPVSEWLCRLLGICNNLVHLDLVLECKVRTMKLPETYISGDISFGRLEYLRLGIDWDEQLAVVSAWETPALKTLILLPGHFGLVSRYLLFLKINGKRLTYLDICSVYDARERLDSQTLKPFLAACPVLEHLCYVSINLRNILDDPALNHRTLAYVDAWSVSGDALLAALDGPIIESHPGLPAFVRYRVLDWDLSMIPDLPLLLPPQAIPGDRLVVHHTLGLEIVEGPHSVFIHGGTLWQDEDRNWFEQERYERNTIIAPSLPYGEWPWDGDSDGTDSSYEPGLSVYSSGWDSDPEDESLEPSENSDDSEG